MLEVRNVETDSKQFKNRQWGMKAQ